MPFLINKFNRSYLPMLNRRHLRVKVLEALYAYHLSADRDIPAFEKQLVKQVHKVYEIYLYLITLPLEIAAYATKDATERAGKYIPSAEDLNPNLRIASNLLIKLMDENPELKKAVKLYKISHHEDEETIRAIFKEFRASAEYEIYGKHDEHKFSVDKELVQFLFKKIVCKNPLLEQQLEEKNISWPVDREVVEGMVVKTLKTAELPAGIQLLELTSNWEEDEDYIRKLFRMTLQNEEEYQGYIAEKTQNWDVDRIALMDTILMKMAICELINFPSIPVKVSINEYIDISKEFSTPKSKIFINGILDKVLVDLKKNNKLVKTGRGLVE